MTTYRLQSSPLINTPGLITWAINAYNFEADRENMLKILVEGYKLPLAAAHALLSGNVPYVVDGDTVSFEFNPQ